MTVSGVRTGGGLIPCLSVGPVMTAVLVRSADHDLDVLSLILELRRFLSRISAKLGESPTKRSTLTVCDDQDPCL